jgi:septum formation topological specificity factor MinE
MHVARLGKESDESVSDRLQLVLATKDLKTLAGKN